MGVGLLLAAAAAASAGAGEVPVEEDYVLHCQACHGPRGAGTPGRTPSLRELGTLLRAPGGRAYLARVPGVAQAALPDARLARLLNWVLTELSDAPPDPVYSATEVRALRSAPIRDTRSARERLLAVRPAR